MPSHRTRLQTFNDPLASPQTFMKMVRVDHIDARVLYRLDLSPLIHLKVCFVRYRVDVLLGTLLPLQIEILNNELS
jgi:hypothetical protein